MITFLLFVMISVGAHGDWVPMGKEEFPDLASCQAAEAKAWASLEKGHIARGDGETVDDEYDLSVACIKHVPGRPV